LTFPTNSTRKYYLYNKTREEKRREEKKRQEQRSEEKRRQEKRRDRHAMQGQTRKR
jgi:hypothetical protein